MTALPCLAYSAEGDYEATLSGYVTKMVMALILLGVVGYFAAKYLPGRLRVGAGGRMRLLGAMSLGRDMIYIVRIGPQVLALFVGKATSCVVGKWGVEEWEEYESLQGDDGSPGGKVG